MEDLEVDQVHSVGEWFFLTSSTGAVHHWIWRIVFTLASRAFPAQDAHQAQRITGLNSATLPRKVNTSLIMRLL